MFIEVVCGNELPEDTTPIFTENKTWIIFVSQAELHLWKQGGQQSRKTEEGKHMRVVRGELPFITLLHEDLSK